VERDAVDAVFHYPLLLAPGHLVTIQASAADGLLPTVSFSGPQGILNLMLAADAESGRAILQTYGITQAGIHEIGVSGAAGRITLHVEVSSLSTESGT
jgi:hypothetical protein